MGRGRAKAKQQKVARELKYNTHFTDLDALQRELGTSSVSPGPSHDGTEDGAGAEPEEYRGDAEDGYENWTGTER